MHVYVYMCACGNMYFICIYIYILNSWRVSMSMRTMYYIHRED